MKLNYNVLWVEDYPKDMKVQIGMMKKIIEGKFLVPVGLDNRDVFKSYASFMKYIDKRDKNDFSNIDLVLVDYNLSDSTGCTGINIVESLRNKNIYTDVIFYSGNIEEAIRRVKDYSGELDNVTYSDNSMNKLLPKFENVLNKQLSLIMQISDLRGYLMDSTSDFDFIMKGYVERIFPLLIKEDQEVVLKEIEKRIEAQKHNEEVKFKKIISATRDEKFANKAMDSQEYVITVKDKIYIMALIFQKYKHKDEKFASVFSEEYDAKIIKYRNKLAHSKLYYGKNHSGHIKIVKKIEDMNCDCSNCSTKLTKEECEELRKHIYFYYSFFDKLLNEEII